MQMTSFTLVGSIGTDAIPVLIRCVVDATKPASFHVEGAGLLPTLSKEIAVRVRSAILSADLCAWPVGRVRIVVESSAAKLSAPALDLPIALAIAGVDIGGLLVAGELGLDGTVRAVRGVLQASLLAKSLGLRGVLVPVQNAREALEAFDGAAAVHVIGRLSEIKHALASPAERSKQAPTARVVPDFSEVRGQAEAITVMEQSVRTRTGLLLSGSPGTGKTMIARRIPGVLPRMTRDEQLAVTCVYSAIGLAEGLVTERPFRAPHHTISTAALTGGGAALRPGEVHLATHGVLFLDEVVEFSRGAIDALAMTLAEMPAAARPLVVAAANPCPCGWRGSNVRTCSCTDDTVTRYAARLDWAAGKLGLTITATVLSVSFNELRSSTMAGESSAAIAGRIASMQGIEIVGAEPNMAAGES
jgi:magnesium chelatase family protein